jgi:hypothetical protein
MPDSSGLRWTTPVLVQAASISSLFPKHHVALSNLFPRRYYLLRYRLRSSPSAFVEVHDCDWGQLLTPKNDQLASGRYRIWNGVQSARSFPGAAQQGPFQVEISMSDEFASIWEQVQ